MSQLIRLLAVTAISSLFSLTSLAAAEYDTVISNGRVIDPETGLDAVRNIGISGNRIVAISASPLEGDHEIDATALVVAPGFIDLHAHGQSQESNEYQARDGVTTALELESGIPNLRAWLAAKEGSSLINYGASVSHNAARTAVMEDYAPKLARLNELIETYGEGWPEVQQYRIQEIDPADYESLDTSQIQSMNEFIKAELDAGGIGIGLLVGYLPGASQD